MNYYLELSQHENCWRNISECAFSVSRVVLQQDNAEPARFSAAFVIQLTEAASISKEPPGGPALHGQVLRLGEKLLEGFLI